MVNMPGTNDAVQLAEANKGLSVGLHFCITEGKPLSVCPSLTDSEGDFLSRSSLIKKLIGGKINAEELMGEFLAQLEKFNSFGLPITHVDSHQHVMMLPPVINAAKQILQLYRLPIRVVNPIKPYLYPGFSRPKKSLKQISNYCLSLNVKRVYKNIGNNYLCSIHDFPVTELIEVQNYHQLMSRFSSGNLIELMVHPYILENDVLKLYENKLESKLPFLKLCEQEYNILSSGNHFSDYELTNFSLR